MGGSIGVWHSGMLLFNAVVNCLLKHADREAKFFSALMRTDLFALKSLC